MFAEAIEGAIVDTKKARISPGLFKTVQAGINYQLCVRQ